MGLMRALTLKRASVLPSRNNTVSKGRPQISLPTELISTTNQLSYTAPSVESAQQKAAAEAELVNSSPSSAYESETSSITVSEVSEPQSLECPQTPRTTTSDSSRRSSHLSTNAPSLTDASSISSSPSTPFAPQNLLSAPTTTGYFSTDSFSKPSSRSSTTSILDDGEIDPLTVIVPALPRRAPSHSKREHERLARRRSQRASMKPVAVPATLDVADDVFSPAPLSAAMTMPELKEVDEEVVPAVTVVEVAEEESKSLEQLLAEMVQEDEETCYMREHGLKRFSVGGYLDLVGDVWGSELLMIEACA